MLKLDDAELDIVMAACRPLDPHRRDSFMTEVAAELAGHQELGPGVVHRVCATVQRRHFDAPMLGNSPGAISKYR
jgi:hypothetical protein